MIMLSLSLMVINHQLKYVDDLFIDYSQTINYFARLDAYLLPNMDGIINKIAQFRVFTSVDLKSAYHQKPLRAEDRLYTAFDFDAD